MPTPPCTARPRSTWPIFLVAFESGAFDARTLPGLTFKSSAVFDLRRSPIPAREHYSHSRSYMHPGVLEFSRGCQFRCSYCASTNLYTDVIRHKSVGQVLAEIATLPEYLGGFRAWFFGDDNFAASHARAAELARAIGRYFPKAKWGSAMTIASARDHALLDALAAGGMRYAFVGFDSIVQESLRESHKTLAQSAQFSSLVSEFKQRDIFVIAALVFGFDHDEPTVFSRTLDWALESGVDVLNLNVLRPYPSSPTYAELRDSGRLLHDPWWLQPFETRLSMVHHLTTNVSGVMTTFRPLRMSAKELAEGTLWVGQQFYQTRRLVPRVIRNATTISTMVVDALTNLFYAREYQSFAPVTDPGAKLDVKYESPMYAAAAVRTGNFSSEVMYGMISLHGRWWQARGRDDGGALQRAPMSHRISFSWPSASMSRTR